MRSRGPAIAILIALAAHAGLAAHRLGFLPETARVLIAALVLLLVPGFAWMRLLGASPPGGATLASGWALGFGVAWNALLLSVTAIARVPFTSLTVATVPLNALLWVIAVRRRGAARDQTPLGGTSRVFVLLAALAGAALALRLGAAMTNLTDSPDHIGTIRRMLEHGTLFPTDAFYRDAGAAGIDPRKFLWHGDAAVITRLAAVEPWVAWRDLPILLTPLLILNVAGFGARIAGGAGAAIAAWVLFLTYGGSPAGTALRETVFAAKLADQLALAATVALLVDLAHSRASSRIAVCVLAAAAAATHVFAAFQLAVVCAALFAGLLARDRALSGVARRLVGTALAAGAAMAPFALWQVLRTPHAANPIHTEPQGLLTLWDHVRVVSPGVLWDWMGMAWLLIPLLVPRVWRVAMGGSPAAGPDPEGGDRDGGRTAALTVITTLAAVAAILFLPLVVAALEKPIGYLLMRVVWMTPLAALVACAIPRLIDDLKRPVTRLGRAGAATVLIAIAFILAPAALDAVHVALHARSIAADESRRSPLRWRADLESLDAVLPAGSVVLSDPMTSYAVPMLTREHVVTLLDQHSSPSDPDAVRRLLDARDALDPYADWRRVRDVIDHYGVDAVVLNTRFDEVPVLDYWSPRPEWFAAERARLDRAGRAFERVYDHGDFVIYRLHRDALASLDQPPPARPFVSGASIESQGIARRGAPDTPGFIALALTPRVAAPLDTVRGVIVWRAVAPMPPGSYLVAVRFDRPMPGGLTPPAWISKPVRKLVERLHRERYRFRADHLPVAGEFGVDLWRPDQSVRDSFSVAVPGDVADGYYAVRVRMIRQPHYPNFRLSDYFFDDDYYSGLPAGIFGVSRHGAPRLAPGQPPPASSAH
ncbi:MAG TPA: hypothetical protein VL123_00245 [Candidatus Udaeobacter sp.]|jgi:hypothetical protein|nr:hypothetical protein [Candidatus Udaeobacter sp.]